MREDHTIKWEDAQSAVLSEMHPWSLAHQDKAAENELFQSYFTELLRIPVLFNRCIAWLCWTWSESAGECWRCTSDQALPIQLGPTKMQTEVLVEGSTKVPASEVADHGKLLSNLWTKNFKLFMVMQTCSIANIIHQLTRFVYTSSDAWLIILHDHLEWPMDFI